MSILGSVWVVSVSPIMTSGYFQHPYYFVSRKHPGGFHKPPILKLSFVPTRFCCKICMCRIFLGTVWISYRPTKEAAYMGIHYSILQSPQLGLMFLDPSWLKKTFSWPKKTSLSINSTYFWMVPSWHFESRVSFQPTSTMFQLYLG